MFFKPLLHCLFMFLSCMDVSSPSVSPRARRLRRINTPSVVMLQQYGHRRRRIWLGSFTAEHRNLPGNLPAAREHKLREEALDAMKTGTYESRFEERLRNTTAAAASAATPSAGLPRGGGGVTFLEMFTKQLTPSDVGKLNRLVIPKKHATRYFPQVASETADVLVEFVDREGRLWQFRYCYWKSSQSYVFTRGWTKFVKEKRLQAKDAVAFYRCEERDQKEGLRRTYCLIDIIRGNGGGGNGSSGSSRSKSTEVVGLELTLKTEMEEKDVEGGGGGNRSSGSSGSKSTEVVGLGLSLKRKMMEEEDVEGEAVSGQAGCDKSPEARREKGLKIFGVCIS